MINSVANESPQQIRKKRVLRMKLIIVASVFITVLLAIILCIVLFVKISLLEKKVDTIIIENKQLIEENENFRKTANSSAEEMISKEVVLEDENASTVEIEPNTETASVAEEVIDNTTEDQKKVYLTFDDGPSTNTAAILDTLALYNVKASFFVVGRTDEESKKMYKRIVDEGHVLAMHSYSHQYSTIYSSMDAFSNDVLSLQNLLFEATGVKPTVYRFPGGSSNTVSKVNMQEMITFLQQNGITYYDWNAVNGDATGNIYSVEELISNVMSDALRFHETIVLMHDSSAKTTTLESLPGLIEQLQAQNIAVLPINDKTKVIQHIKAENIEE